MSALTDTSTYELRWIDGSWGHADLNELSGATADVRLPVPPGGISAYFFAPLGTRHVHYYGEDQHIHELTASGGGWWHEDLTLATGAYPGEVGELRGTLRTNKGRDTWCLRASPRLLTSGG
jgi:hypothetical protein